MGIAIKMGMNKPWVHLIDSENYCKSLLYIFTVNKNMSSNEMKQYKKIKDKMKTKRERLNLSISQPT